MNTSVLNKKKETVKSLTESVKNAKSIAIVSYHGLTVKDLTELRKNLAEKNATLGVYKNTLVNRALKEAGIEGLDEYLSGPNAYVFSSDVTGGPAVLYKFSRYHEELVLKGGYVEGKVVDAAGLKRVAKLPTKEVLLSMFQMVLNEPMAAFARALSSVAYSKTHATNL